ncbi:DUF2076 domain-containing protein [Edaphobacter aggregans]|uniref:DUF2076 domain-containing protein n=1 Tax=Edaphobacter aggregans TaxID=570835 RepID=UPI000553F7CC|nr:DUF2076 domain-containing protein [Edaphobacter aggregans]
MTPQEQQMLERLIQRVNQTKLQEKDFDAEEMLQQTLGRNSDALYILAQTVLVQQYALEQAQKQLEELRQQQAQQPQRSTSFLGSLLGRDDTSRPAPPPAPPPTYSTSTPQYAPAPGYAPAYGAPQSGGFLRGAMQTAAGVAAGALAFQGIESLMHGFGHAAGYGPGFGSFGEGDRPEIINNYYGDDERGHESPLSPDIEDRRGESRFSQAVDKDDHGDAFMNSDDKADNFADDTSSFDDSSDFGDGFDSGDDSGF